MKKLWRYGNNKAIRGTFIITCAILLFITQKSICFADATGKVTAPSAKIRKSADINSEVVGSSENGKTITITAQVTDAAGTVWYEVYVDSNTKGYIRSDLVSVDASSGTIPTQSTQADAPAQTNASDTPVVTASGAEVPAETEMEAQYASVKVPAAKIRGTASTTAGVVSTIPQNTQVIVTGKTNGSDGKDWYYVTFTTTDGQEKTGYVRNDLVTLGEMVTDGEPSEEPQETSEGSDEPIDEPEEKDYDVVFEDNEDGGEWYLYNNLEGKKQKLDELFEAAEAQENNDTMYSSTITKQRIVIIVMILVIVIMAFAITIMLFKLRDAYYEAYEDEEEDAYEKPQNNRREEATAKKAATRESNQTPVRKKTTESEKKMPVREVTYEEEPAGQIKPAPKKKAKNFMLEDEEFEFEFLNVKNRESDK
ncbi:MAG: SH3 domain-containing protein [Lachnospiraceae bacterium]|nr:SH3 domain-containing protein [Lachnospiraceae bacterium]